MDGLAIAASLTEIRAAAESGFVRSVYEPIPGVVVLHVFADRKRRILISPKLSSLHLTELEIPNPEKPSAFAMLLRKHLRGGRISAIRQHGLDRVVEMDVLRRDAQGIHEYSLILELIGLRGNVVLLCGKRVVAALRSDDRSRLGEPYVPLPAQARTSIEEVTDEALAELLAEDAPDRALARTLDGLSRASAKDVLSSVPRTDESGSDDVRRGLLDLAAFVREPRGHFDAEDVRATFYPLPDPATPTETFAEAVDRALEAGGSLGSEAKEERSLRTRLQREIGRRGRTLQKLQAWLDAADEADRLTARADLLMTYHWDVPKKAREVTLDDPVTETPVLIALDPSLTAIENAQRLYERAKRMRRGVPRVRTRLERLKREVSWIEEGIAKLDAGESLSDNVVELLSLRKAPKAKPASTPTPRTEEIGGFSVRVGRSAAENDRMLREAEPNDIWMHVRRYAGSHVIVRTRGQDDVPDEVLRGAARLAGRHSKAGSERRVEVTVAKVKHVRKPRGAPPGLVVVDRADTLTVDLVEKEDAG